MEPNATTTFAVRFYLSPGRASIANPGPPDSLGLVADLCSAAAEEEFRPHGQLLGAVASVSRAIDCKMWPSRPGGELAVTITWHSQGRREAALDREAGLSRIVDAVRKELTQDHAFLALNAAAGPCALPG
jgi:hypothetical protein